MICFLQFLWDGIILINKPCRRFNQAAGGSYISHLITKMQFKARNQIISDMIRFIFCFLNVTVVFSNSSILGSPITASMYPFS